MLKTYQSCRSNEGWVPVQVASSKPPLDYVVMVCPWDTPRECICECKGYVYYGHCRHQEVAFESLCRWNEIDFPEIAQSDLQRERKICPKCSGPTSWQMEVVDEDA